MRDLDAYLDRLGLAGRPDLAEMHRAHVQAIPFENLDPHRGQPVQLDLDSLERKLVGDRRGGYCFEHNLLFKAACEALGADVVTYLARVRWRAAAGEIRARAHLVLGVTVDGRTWLADVGFGAGTPLEPMPFGVGGPYEQSGWTYRVVEDGPELVLQRIDGGTWADLYGFSREPSPHVDIEVSNWYVGAHPQSPYVTGIIVGRRPENGSVEVLSNWSGELTLTTETPDGVERAAIAYADLSETLAARFGLPGFSVGADDRVRSTSSTT